MTNTPVPNIIITGGSGYVAQQLIPYLKKLGYGVLAYSRKQAPHCSVVGDYLTPDYDDADVVIHTAARAHIKDKSDEFFTANTALTVDLAHHLAGRAKNKRTARMIFFSSIGAREMERQLADGMDYDAARRLHPYQLSKLEAERRLRMVQDLSITCLRPPLVYGPACPGNLPRLMRGIHKGWPLPLGSAMAPRHYISITNLMDAVRHIIDTPNTGFALHDVADAEAISTRSLVERLATMAGLTSRLLTINPTIMRAVMGAAGQARVYNSLFEPLLIQNTLSGWQPPQSLFDGLQEFVDNFMGATNALASGTQAA
jgi:nucleoside-diphosphate-sugar epimerase